MILTSPGHTAVTSLFPDLHDTLRTFRLLKMNNQLQQRQGRSLVRSANGSPAGSPSPSPHRQSQRELPGDRDLSLIMVYDTSGVVSLQVRDFVALGTRGHLQNGEVPVSAPRHAPTYEVRVDLAMLAYANRTAQSGLQAGRWMVWRTIASRDWRYTLSEGGQGPPLISHITPYSRPSGPRRRARDLRRSSV